MKSYDTQPNKAASDEITPISDEAEENLDLSATLADSETDEQWSEGTAVATQIVDEVADEGATGVDIQEPEVETVLEDEETSPAAEDAADLDEPAQKRRSSGAARPSREQRQAIDSSETVSDPVESAPEELEIEEGEEFPQDSLDTADYIVAPSEARRGFRWPSRAQLVNWAPFWGVTLLGAILRFWDLGAKPLHHDESLHGYYALQLLHNLQNWGWCVGLNNPPPGYACYQYDPLLHGPFQFHAIALVYQISQWLGAPDNGVNTTTVRIMAALLGSVLVALPYFLRDYMGKIGALLACFLLAVSPSMVYFSRFAREDIYMACFTLLLVVSTARYVRERKMGWLVLAAAGYALSYATSEATFLTVAVFGSFLGALIVWEIGSKIPLREGITDREAGRYLPRTFAGVFVLVYFLILGLVAKYFFGVLNQLSNYINNNQAAANGDLYNLESVTVRVLPWLGILLGLVVFGILALEVYGVIQPGGRRGLARFVDRRQPVLDSILTMPWTHWFFALIVGIAIFLLLFTVVFTNIAGGIGDGIWKGLYYWLEQQQVARGGQPWYYYLLLIPLYEQIGVIFALVGMVRTFWKPNRFRLFIVYWFLGDFFIYSWAGEKMPWLMIFITMPMLLLAAIGLEPCLMACYHFIKERFFSTRLPATSEQSAEPVQAPWPRPRVGVGKFSCALLGVIVAVLALIPTLQNMREVTYVEPADGPHEMMIYVQTTTDINLLMAQVDAVDQKDFGGKHQMRIGITTDGVWPLAWYLRDYPNLCFNYPDACPTWLNKVPVIITGGDDYTPDMNVYLGQEYKMRSWWDEGYKLPPCQPGQTPSSSCADPNLGSGVGPGLWLSYGDNPPPGAKFNLGLTIQRIWNWWWYRQPFGSTGGYYPMALFVQKSMGVNP